jgi:signal transduction histidine kinase
LRSGQSLWIEDSATDPRTAELHKADQRTVAVIPLHNGGNQVGVLYVNWSDRRKLTPDDIGLLETLAAYGAISIAGARLRDHERLARQQAEAEHEQLQAFLRSVAHDLRGPLTLLVAYTELLRQGSLADRYEATQQALPALENAARRVQRLVNDLIDLARINAGEFEVQPSAVDLVEVARDVAAQFQATTDRHAIRVEGPEQLVGEWDPARLRDLLGHLVRNAINFSPDGGPVRIEIGCEGDEARLGVADAGIGIAPEQRERIFQAFSRVDLLPTTKERGLGLYLAKAIVDAHRGQIRVDSEVGRGSTFHVTLPLHRQ